MSADENYAYCLEAMQWSDLLFAYIQSPEESKGMIMELERAEKMWIPIVLIIREWLAHERFRLVARDVLEFIDIVDINELLTNFLSQWWIYSK